MSAVRRWNGTSWEIIAGSPAIFLVTSQTTAYTAINFNLVLANGTFTVTLPAASANAQVIVKNTGTGTITVAPASGTIDGAATFALSSQYASVTLVSDGANWFVI